MIVNWLTGWLGDTLSRLDRRACAKPCMRQAASHTPDEHHAGCTRRAHLVRSGLKAAQVQPYHQVRLGPHCLGLGCLQQRPLQGVSCTAAPDPESALSILLRGLHKLSHMRCWPSMHDYCRRGKRYGRRGKGGGGEGENPAAHNLAASLMHHSHRGTAQVTCPPAAGSGTFLGAGSRALCGPSGQLPGRLPACGGCLRPACRCLP